MSVVTNTILHLGVLTEEDAPEVLDQVNAYFVPENDGPGFVSVRDERLPKHWYGGYKGLEAVLAIGAFNHLDLDDLVRHLRTIEWPYPEWVQLIVQEQNAFRFRVINVFDELNEDGELIAGNVP